LTAEVLITARPRLPLSSFSPPSGLNGRGGTQHAVVAALLWRRTPSQHAVVQNRLLAITRQTFSRDGEHVAVQQPGIEQFADQKTHAAGGVKVVHVGLAVGIDPGEQRHHGVDSSLKSSQLIEMPAAWAMATRCRVWLVEPPVASSADDAVDDRSLVDDPPDREVLVAERGDPGRTLGRRLGQRVAQRGVGMDEGRAGQMQAHHLHQHLVRVGGAVKRASARPVVRLRFRLQQRVAPDLALSIKLANFRLLGVGQARGHRPAGHENRRQVAEMQSADQ
jgi:hypothetical protein